jgi:CelD/BcsL family acetyltransferase involved in cellulose biosynthesis
MPVEWITSEADFHALSSEWNALLKKSAIHVPFLRYEYLCSWWQTKGGGEWEDGELAIQISRAPKGELQGIAPFFGLDQTLMLLGSHEISDYLDLIVPEERLDTFLNDALGNLAQQWNKIDFYNLLESSPTLPALERFASREGWHLSQERIQPSPLLTLPARWETYLDQLDSRYRHEIERKLRRAEGYFLPVDWYFVQEEKDLDAEIDDFMRLMAYSPEKADFLTQVMESQMRKAIHNAFKAGWLQLTFLTVGGKKAASYLNFDYQNRIYVYNSGLNPIFENLSPGWVLLSYLIQWAIQEKREVVDFMRGDEAYKYHFGGKDRFVYRATLERAG